MALPGPSAMSRLERANLQTRSFLLSRRNRSLFEGPMMMTYRCFLISGERLQAVQLLECEDDKEAIAKGTALLESKPAHQAAEIWQGGRFVARVPRPNQSTGPHTIIELMPRPRT